jgi:hypothetical protein
VIKKSFKHDIVGGRYTIDVSGSTFRLSTAKYHGLWPDQEQRGVWQTMDRATDLEVKTISKMSTDASENAMLEVLKPLRREYHRTNAQGKLALEVLLLSWLRRRDRLD